MSPSVVSGGHSVGGVVDCGGEGGGGISALGVGAQHISMQWGR